MKEKIQSILNEINEFKSENLEVLENFRIKFLGKKGQIQDLFAEFKNIPKEQRKEMGLLLNELKNKAKELVKVATEHDLVFINSSTHGKFAQQLKKLGYKGEIICFFHNVEYNIKLERAKQQPWKIMEVFVINHNEKMACKYSNKIIAVNNRDIDELKRIYKAGDISAIPISLKDVCTSDDNNFTHNPPTFLFTGNNWYANIHGITWFIDNVLDKVDIKLLITGHKPV